MNGPSSLNQSITAGWAVSPVASGSTSSAPVSTNGTTNPSAKKRLRRTNLNNAATDPQPSGSNGDTDRPPTPRRKKPKSDRGAVPSKYAPPDLKLSSLGGLRTQITQLMEIVVLPLLHPEIYQHTGVPRPRGVLLHGVPGGGKTQLVKCLAGVSLPFGRKGDGADE